MNDNCVCGFHPPEEPNLDCERCQLICKLARLREAAKEASVTLDGAFATISPGGRDLDHEKERQWILSLVGLAKEQIRKALENEDA